MSEDSGKNTGPVEVGTPRDRQCPAWKAFLFAIAGVIIALTLLGVLSLIFAAVYAAVTGTDNML